ncbi:hypothetical protein ACP70R_021501 [Stipagrostis hirtigluma subsp. patula]
MSHRRRFLNVVTARDFAGEYSLRRVDLHSHQNNLFYPTAAAAAHASAAANDSMKTMVWWMQAPTRSMLFLGRSFDWLALSESKLVCMDRSSRDGFLYDADVRSVTDTLPYYLHAEEDRHPKPICLPVAGAGAEEEDSVYVMERSPEPAGDTEESRLQFRALVHRRRKEPAAVSNDDGSSRWHLDELPPPPYVVDAGYRSTWIDSYTVIRSGASGAVCVSTEGIGTYCFDTVSRAWSKAGDWALPFSGKVEHVPELGVLVGFWASECGHRLCASGDLSSAAGSLHRPMLRGWLNLGPPCGEWHKVKAPQLVSLGSGKFCLAEFFKASKGSHDHPFHEATFAVFTGVEVLRHGRGGDGYGDELPENGASERGLRVIKHKSKRYILVDYNATVEFVF